jgi:hypothetical protein
MNEQRRPTWRGALTATVTLAAFLLLGGQLTTLLSAGATETDGLLGPDLIEALAIQPTSFPVEGCNYLAEVDGKPYCLDGQVSNVSDFRLLAMRMRGHEPSAQDRRLVELMAEAEALQNDMSAEAQTKLRNVVEQARELIDAGATSTG